MLPVFHCPGQHAWGCSANTHEQSLPGPLSGILARCTRDAHNHSVGSMRVLKDSPFGCSGADKVLPRGRAGQLGTGHRVTARLANSAIGTTQKQGRKCGMTAVVRQRVTALAGDQHTAATDCWLRKRLSEPELEWAAGATGIPPPALSMQLMCSDGKHTAATMRTEATNLTAQGCGVATGTGKHYNHGSP